LAQACSEPVGHGEVSVHVFEGFCTFVTWYAVNISQ